MDTYRYQSAREQSAGSRSRRAMTSEEQATHRRWARGVLGLYGTLFLLFAIAAFAIQSSVDANEIAQASTRTP
jgi:hypothetical protein